MRTRMKVASCVFAMAMVASTVTAWGAGFTASATVDFFNGNGIVGNSIVESTPGMITMGTAVIQSTSINNFPVPTPLPSAPFDSLGSAVAPGYSTGVAYDALDPNGDYFAQSHVVNIINAGAQTLPVVALDNLDYQATVQNTVNGNLTAHGIVSYQFAFTATPGQTISVTANTIDLFLNVALGDGMVAYSRYLFTVLDAVTFADLDPLGHVAVTNTYTGAQMAAADGLEMLTQYSYTTPNTLNGTYYLLLQAEQYSAVPEPSTFILAGSGIVGLFLMRRRSRKA